MRLFPALALSGLVILVSILVRPLMPVDETRYLAVAWEMWLHDDYLVPHLNGAPYSHKPPLLFWLIHAGWWLFGVNDFWPRLIPPLFALGSLWLTGRIAQQLWPARPRIGSYAIWLLVASLYWLVFSSMLMFDMLVVFFVLLGVHGLLRVEANDRFGWVLLFLGVALGALAKGPFAVFYLVLVTLAAPLWMRLNASTLHWYLRAGAVGLGGGLVALAWAILAAQQGGASYAAEILWGQMAGRAVDAFDHARPIWWYLPILLAMLLPLSLWRVFWQGLYKAVNTPIERRWLLWAWVVPPLILFSLVSGKQPHYLLPILPALALFVARALDDMPIRLNRAFGPGIFWLSLGVLMSFAPWVSNLGGWGGVLRQATSLAGLVPLALGLWLMLRLRDGHETLQALGLSTAGVMLSLLVYAWPLRPHYDLMPFSKALARLEASHEIAVLGPYHGEYTFQGRLKRPLMVLERAEQVREWCASRGQGVVLIMHKKAPATGPLVSSRYRSKTVAAWSCRAIGEGLAQR